MALLLGLTSLSTSNLSSNAFGGSSATIGSTSAEAFAERSYFYVGGKYVNAAIAGGNATSSGSGTFMMGQVYVERLTPHAVKKKHPLVFIHGAAQSGSNWLNTPDDREGWASYFLRRGYIVYLTDQTQRGRSPWLPGDGELITFSAESASNYFAAPEKVSPQPYPQAIKHTQWPGTGVTGDPIFDAFYASQVQYQSKSTYTALLNNAAYTTLLQKIGQPVFLITHSQAGLFGWKLADTIPGLVKGMVQLEPGSTPFESWTGPPFTEGYAPSFSPFPYGLTQLPLQYDPPIGEDSSSLKRQHIPPDAPDLAPCILQTEPARKLVNIAKVPQLQIVSEASWHAVCDYCSVKYLKQAGCEVEFVPLERRGIRGNGHFLFMEMNNIEIAERVVLPWLEKVGG